MANFKEKRYTVEDIARERKQMEEAERKRQEEIKKQTNAAPVYGNKVPTLGEISRKKVMEGTDPASMSINTREKERETKRALGTTNVQQYSKRFNMPLADNAAENMRQIASQRMTLNNSNTLDTKNIERAEEDRVRREASKKRIEDEVKAIQKKGMGATPDELNRLNQLFNTAENRGLVDKDSDHYLVHRDRYDKLMQDSRLRKDIEALFYAQPTGNKKADIVPAGYKDYKQFRAQLSKRYELTEDELDDMVKTFASDIQRQGEEKWNESIENFSNKHPLMGTALAAASSVPSGVEGWANLITGLSQDDRKQLNATGDLYRTSKGTVSNNIDNPALKFAYDLGVGGGTMALNAAVMGLPGIVAGAGNTGYDAQQRALENGADWGKASGFGLAAAGADAFFNTQGFNAIENRISPEGINSAKEIAKKVLVNFNIEGAENVAQDITESVLDGVINQKNSELTNMYNQNLASGMTENEALAQVTKDYAKQIGSSYVAGGIGGAAFGAFKGDYHYADGSSLFDRAVGAPLAKKVASINSKGVQAKVAASEIEDLKIEIEKYDNAAQKAYEDGDVAKANEYSEAANKMRDQLAEKIENMPQEQSRIDKLRSVFSKNKNEVPRVGEETSLIAEETPVEDTNAEIDVSNKEEVNAEVERLVNGVKEAIDNKEYQKAKENQHALTELLQERADYEAENIPNQEAPIENETPETWINEDTGANPETKMEDEPTIIEEEVERHPYKEDGVSQFATDTMINAGIFDEDTLKNNPTIAEIAKLSKEGHTDADTYSGAMERVSNDGAKWLEDIINGKYVLGADKDKADLDFDTGMILLQGLKDGIETTSDPAEAQALNAKLNLLYGKMQKLSTSAARTLHAHRKWNMTEEGAKLEVNRRMAEKTDAWKTRNKSKVELNDKVAGKLDELGKKIRNTKKNTKPNEPINKQLDRAIKDLSKVKKPVEEEAPKTHEQIVQEIKNTLKKHGLDKQFDDNRIEVLANYLDNLPTWQITDQLRHFLQTGDFYSVDESTPLARRKSAKLANAFAEMGNKTKKGEKEEIGFAKRKERVINTLEDELGSIEGLFPDEKINQLVDLEEKLPTWQLIDELEHYFLHGDFYPITEETPQNLPKAQWLTKIINSIGNEAPAKAEKTPDTFEELVEKVRNSFEDENSSVNGIFNDNDYRFIALMKQEGVPAWQIEDEIRYKMENGTFYSLDESIDPAKPINGKLKSALSMDDGSKESVEKVEPTFDELTEQVKNTLEQEYGSVDDFSEDDYQYYAGLIQNGATKQELADAINTRMANGKYGISIETQREVGRLFKYMSKLNPESKDYAKTQLEAFRLLANEIDNDASAIEKFDSWRYLAMLGNPKTMVRNFIGNLMFNGVTGMSNTIAAIGEGAVDTFSKNGMKERTKSVLVPFLDGKLKKATRKDFDLERYASGAGDKYHNVKQGIDSAKSAFDNNIVRFLEELTNKGISDTGFVKLKYGSSLAGYLKANGLTEADLEASYKYEELQRLSRSKQLTKEEYAEMESLKDTYDKVEKGRDYALEQAKYATFHEDNVVAELLSQGINDLKEGKLRGKDAKSSVGSGAAKALGYGLEGIIPFRKTPANILYSGFEYSPLGAIKSLVDTGKLIYENTGKRKDYDDTYINRKGEEVKKTLANDVIEDWSKNLTGTMLATLGYYLFSKGVLKDSDKETKYQDQLEGLQNYSIEINGRTYTIDWAAPAVMPLLLGAEWAKINRDNAISDKKFYDDPARYWETANKLFEPMVETSMLQGVKDTLETAANATKYNENLSVPTLLAYNALTGYATQALPTIVGQASRLADPTRRSTYTENDGMRGILEKQGRKLLNKTPFSRLNEPYYDSYGRTQSNNPFEYKKGETLKNIGRGVLNAAYQFGSPSYIQEVNTTDADTMSRQVYDAIKKDDEEATKVFSQWNAGKKIEGQRVSAEDNAKYSKLRGETDYAIRDALANDEWFKMLDPDEQAKILKTIPSLSDKVAEASINPNFETKDKAYKVYSEGNIPSLLDYYKDTVHNARVDEEMGTTSDFATSLYDSGDQARIDKYKEGNTIAQQYGYDTLSEDEYLNYEKYGEDKLKKILNYKATAKELGVNNNDTFKKLVDSGISKDSIKQASDAITSTAYGKDEFNRDQYLPFSEETYDVYKNHGGQAGLNDYVKIKQGNANWKTYDQAKKALPTLIKNADTYVSTFNAIDGKAGSKANGTISQDELITYFNKRNMTQAQVNAYWKAFGQMTGDEPWKKVPELRKDKNGKTQWKAVEPKKGKKK